MNLNPVLAGIMPVSGSAAVCPGDSRLPRATTSGEAAAPAGDFARALSDAGAPGRSTSGATPDHSGPPTDGSRAGDEPEAPAAGSPATPAAKAEAADPAEPPPHESTAAASAKASAATAGPAARASSPALKARAVTSAAAAAAPAPALPAASPPSEGTMPADPTPAPLPETAAPGGAAEAVKLLAELQARHPALAAAPTAAAAAADQSDDAGAAAPRLPQRRLAAAAAQTERPVLAESANASASASATARHAPSIETPPLAASPGPVAESVAPALPAGALPPQVVQATALQPGASAGTVAEARLAAAPGSAEFASQLGSQLTTFVRDGVQHARLHLNPAELGPVTVQIRIDGQAAQVHMAAEHGLTRQALEQSMPLLAGSLREAGLTLSGGGVFEQPRQSRDDAQPGRAAGSPGHDTADDAVLHQGVISTRHRGVVDLVA